MSDLLLDDDGDIAIVNGDLAIVMGSDAVKQNLMQRLRFFTGDWFLDTSIHVPYYESIFKKNPDLQEVQAILQNVIVTTPGVLSLDSFDLQLDTSTRKLSVSFQVSVFDGPIVFENFTLGV